jgi:hypothetical protein
MLDMLLKRFPRMALANPVEEVLWRPHYLIRTPRTIVVTV